MAMVAEREAVPGSMPFDSATGARGRIVAFFSGKGGVGKTTLAVNLAALSARRGRRVALLTLPPASPGFLVLAQRIAARARGQIDVGTLDVAAERWGERITALAGCGRNVLVDGGTSLHPDLAVLAASVDQMILVTASDASALADAYGALKFLTAAGCHESVGVLVNQVQRAHEAFRAFRQLSNVAQRYLGCAVDECGFVPFDRRVQLATRQLAAVAERFPSSAAARRLDLLCRRLLGPENRALAGRPALWPSLAGLFL